MDHLYHLLVAFLLGVPPGIVIGFLIGYPAGKARLLERRFNIEVGWGPKMSDKRPKDRKKPGGTSKDGRDLRSYVRLDLAFYMVIGVICVLALATLAGYKCDIALLTALIGLATALVTALVTYLRGKASNNKGDK